MFRTKLYKISANKKYKIMDKLPNYPSATSGVLIGALIALILYIVGCSF